MSISSKIKKLILIFCILANFAFIFWLIYLIIDMSVTIDHQGQSIKTLTETLQKHGIKSEFDIENE